MKNVKKKKITKVIVIDEESSGNKIGINKFIDWLIYMFGYTVILIFVSIIFNETFIIDNSYFGIWAFLASIIIYILNKTIKPIIFLLTLPITGITLGLFYPFINVFIIKIADFILGSYLDTNNIFTLFFVAIAISLMNFLLEKTVIEPLKRREN
ncbi:MAG: phage holin family protein [Bacilli bacterium]|nr:phage holin family protein [Bacilli bacterium]MDD3304694.1 phage holin family protein [Bacilli bacterium]MDD4053254.1 phage holin family protein [Bacilli bacterium]MDD4411222.1 phage holin family protein [Bacilli bacterium]